MTHLHNLRGNNSYIEKQLPCPTESNASGVVRLGRCEKQQPYSGAEQNIPDWDLVEEVVLVRLETNSGMNVI